MRPQVVELSGTELIGATSFHDTFSRAFGFFEGYGKNMDAWIDCMGYLREPDSGMIKQWVGATETLTILIRDHEAMRDGAPKQWADLIECAAFVNTSEIDRGDWPVLALAFK